MYLPQSRKLESPCQFKTFAVLIKSRKLFCLLNRKNHTIELKKIVSWRSYMLLSLQNITNESFMYLIASSFINFKCLDSIIFLHIEILHEIRNQAYVHKLLLHISKTLGRISRRTVSVPYQQDWWCHHWSNSIFWSSPSKPKANKKNLHNSSRNHALAVN